MPHKWTWITTDVATAAVVSETFLALNGHGLTATDAELVVAFVALAAGELNEAELAEWFRGHLA